MHLDGRPRHGHPEVMNRSFIAGLALLAAGPAFAQVRVVAELSLPAAPAVAPGAPAAPGFTAPALGPSLAAPSLASIPLTAAPAPAPVAAEAALVRTGAALSAAAAEGRDQAPVSRQAFDAAARVPGAAAPPVAGGESAALSRLDEPNSPAGRITSRPMSPVKTAVFETAEVGAMALPVAIAAMILRGWLSDPWLLIPAMIALWAAGAWAMRGHLAGLRATVVGGWQASHDQKYRVDTNTGLPRDIRGHKYGSDRYEVWKPGAVGPWATGLIAAASAAAAAAFLLL